MTMCPYDFNCFVYFCTDSDYRKEIVCVMFPCSMCLCRTVGRMPSYPDGPYRPSPGKIVGFILSLDDRCRGSMSNSPGLGHFLLGPTLYLIVLEAVSYATVSTLLPGVVLCEPCSLRECLCRFFNVFVYCCVLCHRCHAGLLLLACSPGSHVCYQPYCILAGHDD